MKKLCAFIFVSMLTASIVAEDLASSFKKAVALSDAQDSNRNIQAYIRRDLMPYYEQNTLLFFSPA